MQLPSTIDGLVYHEEEEEEEALWLQAQLIACCVQPLHMYLPRASSIGTHRTGMGGSFSAPSTLEDGRLDGALEDGQPGMYRDQWLIDW